VPAGLTKLELELEGAATVPESASELERRVAEEMISWLYRRTIGKSKISEKKN
jgi:hypothetical protein